MPPFLDNDIAILELEEEVDLMEYTPICLAGTDVKESGDYIYVNLNMNLDPISNGSYLTEFVINVVCVIVIRCRNCCGLGLNWFRSNIYFLFIIHQRFPRHPPGNHHEDVL